MSLAQLKASLTLWRARLKWRERRFNHWHAKHNKTYEAKWANLRTEAINHIHRRERQIAELQAPRPLTMYDAVNVNNIPANPPAVAGYVDGAFPNLSELQAR